MFDFWIKKNAYFSFLFNDKFCFFFTTYSNIAIYNLNILDTELFLRFDLTQIFFASNLCSARTLFESIRHVNTYIFKVGLDGLANDSDSDNVQKLFTKIIKLLIVKPHWRMLISTKHACVYESVLNVESVCFDLI